MNCICVLRVIVSTVGAITALGMAEASQTTTSYDLPNCGGRLFVTESRRARWVEVVDAKDCSNVRIDGLREKMDWHEEGYRYESSVRSHSTVIVEVRSNSGHTSDRFVLRPTRWVEESWESEEVERAPESRIRIRVRERTHPRPVFRVVTPLEVQPAVRIRYRVSGRFDR